LHDSTIGVEHADVDRDAIRVARFDGEVEGERRLRSGDEFVVEPDLDLRRPWIELGGGELEVQDCCLVG
jgi:hypothetical protein